MCNVYVCMYICVSINNTCNIHYTYIHKHVFLYTICSAADERKFKENLNNKIK